MLPRNAVLLALEGPDPYSLVGGLGTRVVELSAALAHSGVKTTLIFVGDPARPAVESSAANLEYRRFCQAISAQHPGGVYDGERAKIAEYAASVPAFVAEAIVARAAARGEQTLILAEDWHVAPALLALDALLRERKLRDRAVLAWNANNTYGFDTIDWPALQRAARITAVSRYMKFELQLRGVEALVIPNGIPTRLLRGAQADLVERATTLFRERRPLFLKVARFDEDKRWMQAIEAFAALRERRHDARLVIRGGREPYGAAVLARARELCVQVADLNLDSRDPAAALEAFASAQGPIVNVCSYVPEAALLALYAVADAVLANSGKEPFGLVGLEVMAAGGVAVTGSTGEDYVMPFENALACDTGDPRELAALLEQLAADPALSQAIRAGGKATAKRFTWPHILAMLARKLMAA